MSREKDVLTTGEVARICNVAPRTVSKWFDTGKLRGYRIPGSKDRRIPVSHLIRFMRTHGIPLNGLESGTTRLVIADQDREVADGLASALTRDASYDIYIAHSAFEAGVAAVTFKPHVMLLDSEMPGLSGQETVIGIRNLPDASGIKLIAVTSSPDEGRREALRQDGFDEALSRPLDVAQVVHTVEIALGHTL